MSIEQIHFLKEHLDRLNNEYAEVIRSQCEDCEADPETNHIKADEYLCQLLMELGFEKVVDSYRKVTKWHS